MPSEKWFVTWRHTNQDPLEALITSADSKEEGEEVQRQYLARHATYVCSACDRIENGSVSWPVLGNNDNIVTRVRTERAVYKTLGF